MFLLIFSQVALSACASKPLAIKEGVGLDSLGVCVDFDQHVEEDDKLLYLNATKEFVEEYNQADSEIPVNTCQQSNPYQLNFTVQNSRFIDPSEQALYVLLSTAGILYPLSGGKIAFAWLGFNTTNIEVSVSKALATSGKPVYTQFYSSPYFLSADGVRYKHMQRFKSFMTEMVDSIASQSSRSVASSLNQVTL